MKANNRGYNIFYLETAKQKKERLDKERRKAEAINRGENVARLYNDTNRDDGKDHTPLYKY